MTANKIDVAKSALEGFEQSWVLFRQGTVVVIPNAVDETILKSEAIELLKKNGPVYVGTSHADFSVTNCKNSPGWMVTSHHSRIVTFVGQDEMGTAANDLLIGISGRTCRDKDAKELEIVFTNFIPSAVNE